MNNRRISLINPSTIRPSQMFDSMIDEFFNTPLLGGPSASTGLKTIFTDSMDIDMYETDSHIMVEAKVPGFKADDINVKVEDNILVIEGMKKEESEQKEGRKYHLKEMRSQSVYRSLMLPAKVDADKAEAEFQDGIVIISLPKLTETQTKSIKVKTK